MGWGACFLPKEAKGGLSEELYGTLWEHFSVGGGKDDTILFTFEDL